MNVKYGAIMEQTLNIKGIKLNLNFEPQLSPLGRPMRLSGIAKNSKLPPLWVNKSEKWHWIYTFRFLDEKDGFVSFEFDYYDQYLKTEKG